jgi:uncharacterized protein (DUF1330 family)
MIIWITQDENWPCFNNTLLEFRDFETEMDSKEDPDDHDIHKLRKNAHAARFGQPITVEIRGQYQFSNREEKVLFTLECTGRAAPKHILEQLQVAYKSIEILCAYYQGTDYQDHASGRTQEFHAKRWRSQ